MKTFAINALGCVFPPLPATDLLFLMPADTFEEACDKVKDLLELEQVLYKRVLGVARR